MTWLPIRLAVVVVVMMWLAVPAAVSAGGLPRVDVPVTAVEATSRSLDRIWVTWQHVGDDADARVRVERSLDDVRYEAVGEVEASAERFLDEGLEADTLYLYRLVHVADGEGVSRSNLAFARTRRAVTGEAVIEGVTAERPGDFFVVVLWSRVFDADLYEVERAVLGDEGGEPVWEAVGLSNGHEEGYLDANGPREPGVRYRVRAVTEAGERSAWSDPVEAAWYREFNGQPAFVKVVEHLNTPTGVQAEATGREAATVRWEHDGERVQRFAVLRSEDGARWQAAASVGAAEGDQREAEVRQLVPGVGYAFKVMAIGELPEAEGEEKAPGRRLRVRAPASLPSEAVDLKIDPDRFPAKPADLAAERIPEGVRLTWQHRGPAIKDYTLEGFVDTEIGWQTIVLLPPNATECVHRDAGDGYLRYRLTANTPGPDGPTATTEIAVPAPKPPAETTAPEVRGLKEDGPGPRVEVRWPVSQGYGVVERQEGDGPWEAQAYIKRISPQRLGRNKKKQKPATHLSYLDVDIAVGTAYRYRLRTDDGHTDATEFTVPSKRADPAPTSAPSKVAGKPQSDSVVARFTPLNDGQHRRLVIRGGNNGQHILLSQDNGNISATNLDPTLHLPTAFSSGPFDDIALHAGPGDDTITIDASVTTPLLIYPGPGDDTVTVRGPARATIVSLGGGRDTLTGNGVNTSYWIGPEDADTLHASDAERAAGRVHTVARFHQPITEDPKSKDFRHTRLDGPRWDSEPWPYQDDKKDRLADHALWGTGPSMFDADQGFHQNCPQVAKYASFARQRPELLQEQAVELGDGTFAVRIGDPADDLYARLDDNFAPGTVSDLPPSGNLWWLVLEKAHSFGYFLPDAPAAESGHIDLDDEPAAVYAALRQRLDEGCILTAWNGGQQVLTRDLVPQNHAYSILDAYRDRDGNVFITLRNPYGQHWMFNHPPLDPTLGLRTLPLHVAAANLSGVGWSRYGEQQRQDVKQ